MDLLVVDGLAAAMEGRISDTDLSDFIDIFPGSFSIKSGIF
jgi:hypothetical protein